MTFSSKGTVEARQASEVGPKIAPVPPRDPGDPDESDRLFDVEQLRESVAWVVQSVRARWRAAVVALGLGLAAVIAVVMLWPKTYEADGRLLMQRNELMASLVNPGRTIPREAESPTLAAREIVLGRENIVKVMEATNLLEEWDRTRNPLLRAKDALLRPFRNAPTEDDRIDALAGLIEDRLQIGTSEEGAVSFFIRWPDAQMAYRLVDESMKSFLEYRRMIETAAVTESIAILDKSVAELEAQITETVSQLPRRSGARTSPRRPVQGPSGPAAKTVVQLSRLRSELEARQQDIARMTGIRSQQLSEAQGRLTAALTIYTEGHPTVVGLRQTVAQLSRDSPELAAALVEVRELERQYDALSVTVGAAEAQSRAGAIGNDYVPAAIDPLGLVTLGDGSEPVSLRLRVEMAQLAAVRERANAARAELSSAQAGFKYRYNVTRPPRVPRQPAGPNVTAIILVGAIASLLLAIGVPLAMRMSGY